MRAFDYVVPPSPAAAIALVTGNAKACYVGGGTDLLNLMRDGVTSPEVLVDVARIAPPGLAEHDGHLSIAGSTSMRDVVDDPLAQGRLPLVVEALLASASPQVRNMATVAGNLLQRTRCWYFRDAGSPCNKREPGSGCPAQAGDNRWHAIFGGSADCIAVNPSDLAVALVTLDAELVLEGDAGVRVVRVADFYLDPGKCPDRETVLRHGELIRRIRIPRRDVVPRTAYVKVRDRASFEFALVSVAVAVVVDGSATVTGARITLGGVASRPWVSTGAAGRLLGRRLSEDSIREASDAAAAGARPYRYNEFKVELVRRTVTAALERIA